MLPMIIVMSILFLSMTHPLSMGLSLLLQTIMVAGATGLMNPSFWFSYILFLIFLGGMLVLFIYVASIASNEQFQLNLKMLVLFFTLSIIFLLVILFLDPIMISNKLISPLMSIIMLNMSDPSMEVNLMYNKPSYLFTLFIVSYLLMTLIVIVKIMNISSSSLRMSN